MRFCKRYGCIIITLCILQILVRFSLHNQDINDNILTKENNLIFPNQASRHISPNRIRVKTSLPLQNIILLWNKIYGSRLSGTFNSWLRNKCPSLSRNCSFTDNRNTSKIAAAIIFFDWRGDKPFQTIPESRIPEQRYIYYTNESPLVHSSNDNPKHEYFFNLTMTYRLDSDLISPYGAFSYGGYKSFNLKNAASSFKRKTKFAVWVSGHCITYSQREKYVYELRKYIDVDIYGKCGNKICLPLRSESCYKSLTSVYKFYLSFENAICPDYITEKAFDVLRYDIIPVVMNGANNQKVLPPKSYIDVNDFASPRLLALYLKELGGNMDAYLSFFHWKKEYHILKSHESRAIGFCSLCDMLVRGDTRVKSYSDKNFENFWGNKTCNLRYMESMQMKWSHYDQNMTLDNYENNKHF